MTHTLHSIVEKEIERAKASAALPLSVAEIAQRAGKILGIPVHREQVRRILNDLNYTAEEGKHRRWIRRHKQKGDE